MKTRTPTDSSDTDRRIAELRADSERAQRAHDAAHAILAIACEADFPPTLRPSARRVFEQRRSHLRDALTLMSAGLSAVLARGAEKP